MGLIARHLEIAGISTMSMTSALDITRAVKPPRAAFLDFPLGHTTGRPGEPELQDAIVRAALNGLETISEPGTILTLPFVWPEGEGWKSSPVAPAAARLDWPQYQTDTDRQAASNHALDRCQLCAR